MPAPTSASTRSGATNRTLRSLSGCGECAMVAEEAFTRRVKDTSTHVAFFRAGSAKAGVCEGPSPRVWGPRKLASSLLAVSVQRASSVTFNGCRCASANARHFRGSRSGVTAAEKSMSPEVPTPATPVRGSVQRCVETLVRRRCPSCAAAHSSRELSWARSRMCHRVRAVAPLRAWFFARGMSR